MQQPRFFLLSSDRSLDADRFNAPLLGPDTLGAEVTTKPLARQCGLGNIDPQHSADGTSSAIEDAFMLIGSVSPKIVVTEREDKDAIGAMAVFLLDSFGQAHRIDKTLISWVGALDRLGYRNASNEYPELRDMFENTKVAKALDTIALDDKGPIADKVALTARILVGDVRERELSMIAARRAMLQQVDFSKQLTQCGGQIGFIRTRGNYRLARQWGNRYFAFTVVHDEETDRWTTITRPDSGFDRGRFERGVNELVAASLNYPVDHPMMEWYEWGGNRYILSSPSGRFRNAPLQEIEVLSLARECLECSIAA